MNKISDFLNSHWDYFIVGIAIILIICSLFFGKISKDTDSSTVSFRFVLMIVGLFLLVMIFVF